MKKLFSRFISGLLTSALIIFSIPNVVYGDYEVDGMTYKFGSGGVILTECKDTAIEKLTIPKKALINNLSFDVIGISDYAFGYCNDLSVIHVPSTLKNSNMGNVAFLNAASIVDFINGELGKDATFNDVVKYIAKQINYNNGNYTDDDINTIAQIILDKISKVDTSGSDTLEDKVMTLIKNIDQMGLSDATLAKFDAWIANVTYNNITIKGEGGTEIQQYVTARESLGLKYAVTSIYSADEEGSELHYKAIDTDGDGVNDSIAITGYSGNVQEIEIPAKIDKLPVVEISENAFIDALMLNTVIVPKTVETIGNNALGYFPDGTKISDFTVKGYSGTAIERYALKNGLTFVDLTALPVLSNTELELDVDEMFGLTVKNYSGEITWVSSDTTIATVNEGYVKGISGGEVIVYAFAGDTTLECKVKVKAIPVISTITAATTKATTLEPVFTFTSKITTASETTTMEPAISLTSKITTVSVTTLETAFTLTTGLTTATTIESAITLTSPTTSATTTMEPAISLTSKTTASSSTTTSKITSATTSATITSLILTTATSTSPIISSTSLTTTILTTAASTSPIIITTSLTTATSTSVSNTSISTSISTVSSITKLTTSESTTTEITTSESTTTEITTSESTTTELATSESTTTELTTSESTTTELTTSESTTTKITTSESTTTKLTTSLTTTTTPITTVTTTVTTYETRIVYIGDANEDTMVNVRDAAYIAKILSIDQVYILPFTADFNQDGVINVRDSAALARALASGQRKWIEVVIRIYPI